MRKVVRIGAGLGLMALAGLCPSVARAQWFARPYPNYYPGPMYGRPYYPPPPVYQPVYPPAPVYAPPVYLPPPPPRPSASLMEVQRLLAGLGYDPGPVDGLPGPRLSEAVQAFQRDHEQSANGRLTGETIGAIREAARGSETQRVPLPGPLLGPGPGPEPLPGPVAGAPSIDNSSGFTSNTARSTLSVKPPPPP